MIGPKTRDQVVAELKALRTKYRRKEAATRNPAKKAMAKLMRITAEKEYSDFILKF